jgi:hypothetical protein
MTTLMALKGGIFRTPRDKRRDSTVPDRAGVSVIKTLSVNLSFHYKLMVRKINAWNSSRATIAPSLGFEQVVPRESQHAPIGEPFL